MSLTRHKDGSHRLDRGTRPLAAFGLICLRNYRSGQRYAGLPHARRLRRH